MSITNLRSRAVYAKTIMMLVIGTLAFALSFGLVAANAEENVSSTVAQPIAKGQKLFIAGHSFNIFICEPLEALADEAGIQGHTTYGVQFIGNSTPMQHWNQATDKTNLAKRALRTGELDVFTISPNATMPEEGIDKFADLAQQTTPNIRLLVQQSWPAWDGNAPNFGSFGNRMPSGSPPAGFTRSPDPAPTELPQFPMGCLQSRSRRPLRRTAAGNAPNQGDNPSPTPPTGARSNADPSAQATSGFVNADRDKMTADDIEKARESNKAYMDRMRAQLQSINKRYHREMAYIVPAAEAVRRLRLQVIGGKVPGISKQSELFADAMGHPGPALSDLVSYVWFASLYHHNPLGLTALDKENTEASKARHRLLQQIAWQSVIDEPMSGVHADKK